MAVFPVTGNAVSHSGSYAPIIFAGKLLVKFYEASVVPFISNTDYEGEIKNHGDTARIRTVPDVAINDYQVGMNLVYQDLTPGHIDLLIDKGKYFGVNIRDVQKVQSDIAFMDKWAEDASEQLKRNVDKTVLAGCVGTAHSANRGATAGVESASVNLGVTGTPIELDKLNIVDKIVELGLVLDEQSIPETGRYVVLPPWAAARIKTSELKDASLTGDGVSTLRNGKIGSIDRFTLYSTNNLAHVTDSTKRCCSILAGHKAALTFASQISDSETIKNPNDFGDILRGLQVFGYKNIKPEAFAELYATPKAA